MYSLAAAVLGLASLAAAQSTSSTVPNTSTSTAAVAAELATATPLTPVSNLGGKVFDRIAVLMMENIDLATALENQPNHCVIRRVDNYRMDNGNFNQIPGNVSTLFVLSAEKCISFGEYHANNYVRKDNLAVLYNKNVLDSTRLKPLKSFTSFYGDMDNNVMPQCMFITPNMRESVSEKNFMNNTLLVINFDEDETYTIGNRFISVLISDTMPAELNLHHLGRWDTHANVPKYVANTTGDVIRAPDVILDSVFMNQLYPGDFAATYWGPMLAPNVLAVINGRSIFGEVLAQWGDVRKLLSDAGH
ncbi:hypothetical protein BDZ45DRAFT_705805 [Acephala macrosclerotiorum]|nr:hypothetical protein BDZ45DRAFT_705805 [Acephala macrosclerotiorum]